MKRTLPSTQHPWPTSIFLNCFSFQAKNARSDLSKGWQHLLLSSSIAWTVSNIWNKSKSENKEVPNYTRTFYRPQSESWFTGWIRWFILLKSPSSSSLFEIQRSETKRENQTMSGVRKKMRPKGTIQSCLFVGWYLCSHHPSKEPPPMLINIENTKTIKYGLFILWLSLQSLFSTPFIGSISIIAAPQRKKDCPEIENRNKTCFSFAYKKGIKRIQRKEEKKKKLACKRYDEGVWWIWYVEVGCYRMEKNNSAN